MALADHRQVLVLAEAGEIERLAVDQEPNAVHLDGAYADALVVAVHDGVAAYQLNLKIVEVAVTWCPLVHVRNAQCAARSGGRCDLGSVGVPQDHLCFDIVGGFRFDGVADHTVVAVEVGGDRDVGDVRRIGGVEPDVPVDSGVIEEVVPIALPFTGRGVLDHARRDRLPMECVIDQCRDAHLLPSRDMIGDVGFERGVPALVRHHLDIVDPNCGPVGGRFEVAVRCVVPASLAAPKHWSGTRHPRNNLEPSHQLRCR